MSLDFAKFNKKIDVKGLKEDIKNASENSGDYREVPTGTYEVKITKLELVESKKGDPMVSIWFKILSGEYKNSNLFMNQVITQGFQIHIIDDFLKSLDSGVDIVFDDYVQYAQLLLDVHEAIDGKLEYAIEYGEKKGYSTFKVTEIFDVE